MNGDNRPFRLSSCLIRKQFNSLSYTFYLYLLHATMQDVMCDFLSRQTSLVERQRETEITRTKKLFPRLSIFNLAVRRTNGAILKI
jgi:hypothetical protein